MLKFSNCAPTQLFAQRRGSESGVAPCDIACRSRQWSNHVTEFVKTIPVIDASGGKDLLASLANASRTRTPCMIELLFTKHANATNIRTIVAINAIIFQHARLELIDTAIGAFHIVVATILTTWLRESHAGYIWFLRLHCINLARL